MDLKETDLLGSDIDHHWYYRAKAKAISRMLGGVAITTILDVGAGSGFFSRYLLKNTTAKEAWCVDISYEHDHETMVGSKMIHYRRAVAEVNADLALLMDVLEHVDDDIALLKEYVDNVPHGSKFLITVPAFDFLWSGHDDFLGHRRRYTLKSLKKVVDLAGLRIQANCYFFGMVFPIALILRLAEKWIFRKNEPHSQLSKHHPLVNTFLSVLCTMEILFMRANRIAGLTVICLAEKP